MRKILHSFIAFECIQQVKFVLILVKTESSSGPTLNLKIMLEVFKYFKAINKYTLIIILIIIIILAYHSSDSVLPRMLVLQSFQNFTMTAFSQSRKFFQRSSLSS